MSLHLLRVKLYRTHSEGAVTEVWTNTSAGEECKHGEIQNSLYKYSAALTEKHENINTERLVLSWCVSLDSLQRGGSRGSQNRQDDGDDDAWLVR